MQSERHLHPPTISGISDGKHETWFRNPFPPRRKLIQRERKEWHYRSRDSANDSFGSDMPSLDAGTLNDSCILNLSPLLDSFLIGTFDKLESPVVPSQIFGQDFDKLFVLVDGIYNLHPVLPFYEGSLGTID
jgi:hypothetical protein